jgi:hypothetical protein
MLLIIGNGFDIGLGLKTKYSDFVNAIETEKYFGDNEFKKSNLFLYLKKSLHESNVVEELRWVDIENELKNYALLLINSKLDELEALEFREGTSKRIGVHYNEKYSDKRYRKIFFEIASDVEKEFNLLNKSLKKYFDSLFSKEIEFKNSLPVRFTEYLNQNFSKRSQMSSEQLAIINFNYTADFTLKKLINDYNQVQLINAHGTIAQNNMILGIEGKFNLPTEFNFLKKPLQYNYPSRTNIENQLLSNRHIIFYGFSIGETDSPYFKHFFGVYSSPQNQYNKNTNNLQDKIITIYHKGKRAYDDIIKRIDELTDNNVDRFRQYNQVEFIDIEKFSLDDTKDFFTF